MGMEGPQTNDFALPFFCCLSGFPVEMGEEMKESVYSFTTADLTKAHP